MKKRIFEDFFGIITYNSFFKTFFLLVSSIFLSWNFLANFSFFNICFSDLFVMITKKIFALDPFNFFKYISGIIIFFGFVLNSEIIFTYYIYRRKFKFFKFITTIFETYANFIIISFIGFLLNITLLLIYFLCSQYLPNLLPFNIFSMLISLLYTNIFLGFLIFMLYFDLYLPCLFIHKRPKDALEEMNCSFTKNFFKILLVYAVRFLSILIIIESKSFLLDLFTNFNFDNSVINLVGEDNIFLNDFLFLTNQFTKVIILTPLILPIYYINKVIFMNYIVKRR